MKGSGGNPFLETIEQLPTQIAQPKLSALDLVTQVPDVYR